MPVTLGGREAGRRGRQFALDPARGDGGLVRDPAGQRQGGEGTARRHHRRRGQAWNGLRQHRPVAHALAQVQPVLLVLTSTAHSMTLKLRLSQQMPKMAIGDPPRSLVLVLAVETMTMRALNKLLLDLVTKEATTTTMPAKTTC